MEGKTVEVHNKRDADAYSFSNLPENGDDGAPG